MTRRVDPSTPQQKVASLRAELAERGKYHRVSILDVLTCLAEIDRLEKLLSGEEDALILRRHAFAAGYAKAALDAQELVERNAQAFAQDVITFLIRGAQLRTETADRPEFAWMKEGDHHDPQP